MAKLSPSPDLAFEHDARARGLVPCGVDEAGRGPWAGPVVAAAVILDPEHIPAGLNDSKKLTEDRREALYDPIMALAKVGVGLASAAEIDEINILQATFRAMADAVSSVTSACRAGMAPTLAFVDGNRAPRLSIPVTTIVGGDARCLSIAAASIIAKVTRDRIMRDIDRELPQYGFANHKGYGTAAHVAALKQHGPCAHHRMSYAPLRKLMDKA